METAGGQGSDGSNGSREIDLGDPSLYVNREFSLLEFQRRVLEEAADERHPLLERVKFLAILGSNLDEFFMVRVAGLRQQLEAGIREESPDGLTPAEQLAGVQTIALEIIHKAKLHFQESILPALARAGVVIKDHDRLDEEERRCAALYFEENVFPVLTPLAADPARPFPLISNLSLNLAVLIRDANGEEHFARVKVPRTLPRLVPLGSASRGDAFPGNGEGRGPLTFTWLEQIVGAHLDSLFPGMEIRTVHPFRITRDADVAIQELEAADLLESIAEGVSRRRFGAVVRLSILPQMPARLQDFLVEKLEIEREEVSVELGPLGLSDLQCLQRLDRPDLKDPPLQPRMPPRLAGSRPRGDLFAAIREGDILLHHPYESFAPVVDLLRRAAVDPEVLAIKMTLYRVGKDSPVVEALMEAGENGKQVAVLVELRARFDEASNIEWARALEQTGVHVVYGLLGLKTHSKVVLIVRREDGAIRRYVHLSTGNYNHVSSQSYTDLGLFTDDPELGADATDLFNYLTGYSTKSDYRKLLVAPVNLRPRLESLIEREIEHQRQGRGGHLIFKINALVDPQIIRLLYQASRAGVRVDLLVRGISCLRPGVPEVSDRIAVTSILGRFLEHSRIFYFRNGGSERIFLGSADLMPRNLDRRVEVLFPVEDLSLVRRLRDEVLSQSLADNRLSRRMQRDGSYERLFPGNGAAAVDSQELFLRGPGG